MDRAIDFEGLTPDQLEQVLGAAERRIARLRWIQVQAIRSAIRQQVPLGDGCRTTAEWIRGRVDTTPETARSLEAVADLDDGIVELTAVTADGTPLAVGTARSAIPPRTRRYVLARDGGCVADGCMSTTRVQPHHIRPRSRMGDNDPANLATLCWYHHHVVVHGRGFRIDRDSPALRRRFLPPDIGSNDPP